MRVYSISFDNVSVSAAQDLLSIDVDSNLAIVLLSAYVGASGTADFGDAEAEGLRIGITRYTAKGTGGTDPAIRAHNTGGASQLTSTNVGANDTSQGTSPSVVLVETMNVQAGWFYQPVPDERIWVVGGATDNAIAVELHAGPADAVTMSGRLTFGEFGG